MILSLILYNKINYVKHTIKNIIIFAKIAKLTFVIHAKNYMRDMILNHFWMLFQI